MKTLKRIFFGLLISMTSLTAVAEIDVCEPFKDGVVDTTIVSKMLSAAEDGHLYRINPASSKVGFCVDTPIGLVEGEFSEFTGGLTFLEGHVADDNEQALVMVQTKSLDTDGIFIEKMLKGEKFFDVENYPEILFVSTGFNWVSETEAVLLGELTMHGVTREVGFHVELIQQPDDETQQHILVKATTLIRRSEFGLTSLYPMVSDSVSLCMSVDAVRVGS